MSSAAPVLGLRMKGTLRLSSIIDDSRFSNLVDQVHAMESQDTTFYKCSDYLARRANKKIPLTKEADDDDCPILVDEDIVDAVCREKMCEWSYRVCDHFGTGREVVAVSFSYLDRFMDRCNCDRTAFKLAAMTALYMATKIFNTKKITPRNLVQLSKGEFEERHILEMEMIILKTLSWRLHPPTIQCFIDAFCAALPISDSRVTTCVLQRAVFFGELALYDYNMAVTKEKAMVATACILNAIEGLEPECSPEERQSDFLGVLKTNFGIDFLHDELGTIRHRLWYVYSMSAQYHEDEVASVQELPAESPMVKTSGHDRATPMDHSPVCVTST